MKTENEKWSYFKRAAKKPVGFLSSVTKAGDSSAECFLFFKNYMDKEVNITVNAIAGISGLITQLSILYSDPIKKIPMQDADNSNDENTNLLKQ